MASAAPRRSGCGLDISTADIGEDRTDGRQVGRYDHINPVALQQINVTAPVDQGNHPSGTQSLGQQGRHDVVFVVIGQRPENVHLVDVFAVEQVFVGRLAGENQGVVQMAGQPFAACAAFFNDLDLVAGFQLAGQPVADIAAPAIMARRIGRSLARSS